VVPRPSGYTTKKPCLSAARDIKLIFSISHPVATSQLSGGAGATSGALVSGLSSGGPAAKAGVQDGDVITKIDGIPVTDAPDLLTVLATEKPVDTVTLGLDRNGSSLSVQVQLGELPG
jgi:putative serine protease PepD